MYQNTFPFYGWKIIHCTYRLHFAYTFMSVDIWVFPTFWLLWIKLLWTWRYKYLVRICSSISLVTCIEVEFLDWAFRFLRSWKIFWGTKFLPLYIYVCVYIYIYIYLYLYIYLFIKVNFYNINLTMLKVHNSVELSTFTILCNHHLYLFHFHCPQSRPHTH